MSNVLDGFFSVTTQAKELLENVAIAAANQVEHKLNLACDNIKLPTITHPKYNGSYTKWLEFRDTYNLMIHDSNKLSEIQISTI